MRIHVTYTATPDEVAVANYLTKQTGRSRGDVINSLLRAYASGQVSIKGLPQVTPHARSATEYEGMADART